MGKPRVVSARGISTSDISVSRIRWIWRRLALIGVPPRRWLLISCPSLKRAVSFESWETTSWVQWDAWDAIKPKAGVVSLGQKKASKKLVKESKVNGKQRIHGYWQQEMRQGYVTVVLIPLCHRSVLGFILCRRYPTVDGWIVDRLHLEVSFRWRYREWIFPLP